MKKKVLCLTAAVILMAYQATMAMAASSPSAAPAVSSHRDRDDSRASSQPLDLDALGITNGSAKNDASVINHGVSVAGHGVNVRFASDAEVKESLPWYAAEDVFTINSGTTALYRVVGTPDLVGYNPLIPVQTLVADGTADAVSVSVYVPNLIEGLNNVQILYFNPDTKQWEMAAPAAVDFASKNVAVSLKNGTPFTVVYKN